MAADKNLVGKVALVTGANKGLGFEISRQLAAKGITVAMGARDPANGQSAAERLRAIGSAVQYVPVDVTDQRTVNALPGLLESRFGRLDILVNNAGILLDGGTQPSELRLETLRDTFETNVFGAFAVTRAVLPLILRSRFGRIVNMSSTLGSLTATGDPASPYHSVLAPAYQASKAALNALTVLFAKELGGSMVKVNSACPGWVRTDMGSDAAPLGVEEGADTPVWLATLPDDGPSGGFFNARSSVPW